MAKYLDRAKLTYLLENFIIKLKGMFSSKRLEECVPPCVVEGDSNFHTYTHTCTANDTANGYLYFLNVHCTSDWYVPWEVHYRLKITTTYNRCQGIYDVKISRSGTTECSAILNQFNSTSYYPIYYHLLLHYDTKAKFDTYHETDPIKCGVRVYSAYTPTTLARTYEIQVLSTTNCTVSFPDNIETYDTVYTNNSGASKYAVYTYNATTVGLQETSDSNDMQTVKLYYTRLLAGSNGIKQYSLIMQKKDGTWESFTTTDGTAVTKTKNPSQFIAGSKIYYCAGSYSIGAGSYTAHDIIRQNAQLVDLRFSLNINTTAGHTGNLLPRKPVYIVGTIDSSGYFVLADTWWTQTEPTSDDGKVYIKVGESVYADYENDRCYRADLVSDGAMYAYRNGGFRKLSGYDTSSIEITSTTPSSFDSNTIYFITQ